MLLGSVLNVTELHAYILKKTMNTRLCSCCSSSELAEASVIASSCSLLQAHTSHKFIVAWLLHVILEA